jgi:hypothetical protein
VQGAGELLENGCGDGEAGGPAHGLPGPHRGRSRPAHHSNLPNAPRTSFGYIKCINMFRFLTLKLRNFMIDCLAFSFEGWRLLLLLYMEAFELIYRNFLFRKLNFLGNEDVQKFLVIIPWT